MAGRPLDCFLLYILELPIGPFGRCTRDRKGVPGFVARFLLCALHREAQKPNWRRPSQNAAVAKSGEFSEVRMPAEYAPL